ncbi:glycosyltransferase family 4 protein [Opitutus terrae]|uniref:Glycosyl transferase group 1 n=1 Tax=Opitutus terrae (strain DSM 11246 / JCM 15787 / PB90-1) TaxID=452637 RepID=B1ZZU1_OPITP|nr:glycosyltransferase [Opitutus terrae]ACB77277.1 glycosyl transferase group 1 [Opitutus terrae PB90-1]
MASARSTSSSRGTWRAPSFSGLFFDNFATDSAWIRETAVLDLPPSEGVERLLLRGEYRPHPDVRGIEVGPPSLICLLDGTRVATLADLRPGPFSIEIPVGPDAARRGLRITLRLGGTGFTNLLAWLGRIVGLASLQRFRVQNKNRQIRIETLTTQTGETVYDFAVRLAPFSLAFARRHTRYEFNLVGFLTAELGVGESARCMVRAADAAGITTALVPLKLHCKNRRGDLTYASRLRDENPYRVNVIHIDPPASRDLDHHHGPGFRAGKYNVAYWAWELPEFPDTWVPDFAYYDEVWCPSDFTREAIAMKSPRPVITMPHAISFPRPTADGRARFGLPRDKFLFLFLYDLNSYSARKNPQAVLAAFRASGLAGAGAALVIKVQNERDNPEDFAALQAAVRDLPDTVLITGTLPREEIYLLESACDCFVSLHRSEGFGLAVAESMYLGKPVISTDWSGTAEFVNADSGCPIRYTLTKITTNSGPYGKGQLWAEPDVNYAAEWMRRLFADRALAARLGAAARATIETRLSPATIGERYRRRLESIATF